MENKIREIKIPFTYFVVEKLNKDGVFVWHFETNLGDMVKVSLVKSKNIKSIIIKEIKK
jgi:hypothetical protein